MGNGTHLNLDPRVKLLGGIGSILIILSWLPYIGALLGLAGVILVSIAFKALSDLDNSKELFKNWLIALVIIVLGSFVGGLLVGLGMANNSTFFIAVGVAAAIASSAVYGWLLSKVFSAIYELTGEQSFKWAAKMFFWGAILSVVLIGGILYFVGWILSAIGFFSLKVEGQGG